MKMVKTALINVYYRHHPLDYKKEYNFKENWQEIKIGKYA